MSSFFTLPASQKKRKRARDADKAPVRRRQDRDDSISGSEASGDDAVVTRANDDVSEDEDDEFEDEDPAAKRVRLAEQYLENTQKEILADVGFDAADVDKENLRRRMGERLKEDTAESKGKLYRWIADDFDWTRAKRHISRLDCKAMTAVAVHGRYAYVGTKDMSISRWELPGEEPSMNGVINDTTHTTTTRRPKRVRYVRGSRKSKHDRDYKLHTGAILCVAVSPDGKYLASGGVDKKLIVWDAASLQPLKVFTQHRDWVTSLAFRRGTNQLFSASKDRTVKIWSLDELAYVETLFGHQDEVVDVSALAQEKCITVGARDRTARLWKVVEESQLVFRGGAASGKGRSANGIPADDHMHMAQGSVDRVACIDDETFVTGSDNGTISLWNIHKKKPVSDFALAHGLDPPLAVEELLAEAHPEEQEVFRAPQARWITALRAIPFSDVFITGSWDGHVRAWRISSDKRHIEPLGSLELHALASHRRLDDQPNNDAPESGSGRVNGVVNDLAIVDRGPSAKAGLLVAAAVGNEPRLGRYKSVRGSKNCMLIYEVPRKMLERDGALDNGDGKIDGHDDN